MAKAYSPPKNIPVPLWDFNCSVEENFEKEQSFIKVLKDYCHDKGSKSKYTGKILRWGVADGYAQYMVFSLKPLVLIHLPIGDAWHMDACLLRNLKMKDVKELIDSQERLAKFFGFLETENA